MNTELINKICVFVRAFGEPPKPPHSIPNFNQKDIDECLNILLNDRIITKDKATKVAINTMLQSEKPREIDFYKVNEILLKEKYSVDIILEHGTR